MPESPASSPRPFDFADLGRPLPKSVRALPTVADVPQADASGQLEELDGDDILESDDIDALEAAAAGISSFEVDTSEDDVSEPVAVAAPEPSGFEVGDLDSFDEVQVEGPAPVAPAAMAMTGECIQVQYAAPAPARAPAPMAMTGEAIQVHYAAPVPTTSAGVPTAPVTSPLPLEQIAQDEPQESVIVAEGMQERTLEIRGNDMAKVAAAAAQLEAQADAEASDGQPGHTEVLVRSAMPAALQTATVRGSTQAPAATPAPAPVAHAHAAHAHSHARPSSIAPVALDVAGPRPTMGSIPLIPPAPRMPSPSYAAVAPKRSGMSGLAIGAIVFAAVAVVGTVGVGGFFASRAFSEKSDSTASASSEVAPESAAAAAANGAPESSPSDPSAAASSPIDVSSLPAAPVPGSAPRGFTGKGTATFAPPAAPVPAPAAAPAPLAVAGGVAPAAASPAPVSRSAGGALPAPGSGQPAKTTAAPGPAGAPLAAPVAAAAPAAAPAKAAPVSTTGVIQVDPNLRAVIVDGSYRRANDGAVTVSCGSHRIKAGMKEQQTVNVPCGGSVSL